MATTVFPQTDDHATVTAWADLIEVVNRGAEDPLTIGTNSHAGTGSSYATTGDRGVQIWDGSSVTVQSDTYDSVFPTGVGTTFTVPAGEQWFTEVFFSIKQTQTDGTDDQSRVRLTAPAGGTWTGVLITTERAPTGSSVRCKRFSLADGATEVLIAEWRSTAGLNEPMMCMIVGLVSGDTTGGTIKVEASHNTNSFATITVVGAGAGGKTFFNGVRILG